MAEELDKLLEEYREYIEGVSDTLWSSETVGDKEAMVSIMEKEIEEKKQAILNMVKGV